MFLEKLFRAFFPLIFWLLYSCAYKKLFFAIFRYDFYRNIFLFASFVFSGKIVSRFSPPFFDNDIRMNIKNVFSRFFATIFFPTFLARFISVFLEKLFRAFFPPIFWTRYSCEYKKTFFALFSDDYFPNIFCTHYSCVSGKIDS